MKKSKLVIGSDSYMGGNAEVDGEWIGACLYDPEAFECLLPVECLDAEVGKVLRTALSESRFFDSKWTGSLRDTKPYDNALARTFGLSSSRGLYPGMKSCSASWFKGEIAFIPTRNRRGGTFEGFTPAWQKGHEDVVILFDSPDDELGAAVRECLRRCV